MITAAVELDCPEIPPALAIRRDSATGLVVVVMLAHLSPGFVGHTVVSIGDPVARTELELSDRFADVRQTSIRRRVRLTASAYIGHLSTVSAYAQLADDVRERVFARILATLPEHVVLDADLTVHFARLMDVPLRPLVSQ